MGGSSGAHSKVQRAILIVLGLLCWDFVCEYFVCKYYVTNFVFEYSQESKSAL